MKIQIKNLRGDQTGIEVEPEMTVLDTKRRIEAEQGHTVDSQKLLFKGKILEDSKTLQEYQIEEAAVCVLMITRQKPPARPHLEPQPVPAPAPEPVRVQQNIQASHANEVGVNMILEMGFTREQATAALLAADNNMVVAVDYLMNGSIPQGENSDEDEDFQEPQGSGIFDFLLDSPEFVNIREVIMQNPSELNNFLAQLETTNPDLLALIDGNMEEFIRLLGGREPREEAVLTEAEQNDVRELVELGFTEEDALEAYLGCGKDKEAAASILFEGFRQNEQGFS